MKRHDLDLLSLCAGAVFLAIGLVGLLTDFDLVRLAALPREWVLPVVAIGTGVAILASLRPSRHEPGVRGTGPGIEPGVRGTGPGIEPGVRGAGPGIEPGVRGADPGIEPGVRGAGPGIEPGVRGADPGIEPREDS